MSAPEDFARELRRKQSETERLVWSHLRGRRFMAHKFRRQVALGSYIVDFVCFDERLVVELDGGQHTLQRPYDAERTAWLESQGYRVLRFWNHEVWRDWDAVAEVIWRALHQAPLTPGSNGFLSPLAGEDGSPDKGETGEG
ncbi:MAG: hypothetical protein C0483_20835 [Pirellula sp.]|nr:hypothetical protein [Pirellula sp.]